MSDAIKVTVSDPITGEVLAERVVDDDYCLICTGKTYLDHTQIHANGTQVLTIKGGPFQPRRMNTHDLRAQR